MYEFTSYVPNGATGAPADQFLTLYVRARDATGLMQWGYGPSGFFPQWIYPDQRAAITGEYGNSVGRYLSGDPRPDDQPGGLLLHPAAPQGAALLREPRRPGRQRGIARLALVRQRRTAVRRRGPGGHLQRCDVDGVQRPVPQDEAGDEDRLRRAGLRGPAELRDAARRRLAQGEERVLHGFGELGHRQDPHHAGPVVAVEEPGVRQELLHQSSTSPSTAHGRSSGRISSSPRSSRIRRSTSASAPCTRGSSR